MHYIWRLFIRILEVTLCAICCVLAGALRWDVYYFGFIKLTCVIAGIFLFVTLLDLVAIVLINPMESRIWVMVCTAGLLFFALCAGVFPFMYSTLRVPMTLVVCSFLASIAFLIDLLMTIMYRESEVYPTDRDKKSGRRPRSNDRSRDKRSRDDRSIVSRDMASRSGARISRSANTGYFSDNTMPCPCPMVRCVCPAMNVVPKCECPHPSHLRKRTNDSVNKTLITSYGGTFPVSKEATPLPSPEKRSSTQTSLRTIPSRKRSPRECGSQSPCPVMTACPRMGAEGQRSPPASIITMEVDYDAPFYSAVRGSDISRRNLSAVEEFTEVGVQRSVGGVSTKFTSTDELNRGLCPKQCCTCESLRRSNRTTEKCQSCKVPKLVNNSTQGPSIRICRMEPKTNQSQ